jgi:hypothetical protein
MIDHAAVNISDLEPSKQFYEEAVKPLPQAAAGLSR